MKLDAVADELRRDPLVHGGLLKPGGEREVRAALSFWQGQGKRAFVLMLPGTEAPRQYRGLWQTLALDAERDLLLICNGLAWDLAGWRLPQADLAAILEGSEAGLHQYWARGLTQVLDEAGRRAFGIERAGGASRSESDSDGWALGTSAVLGTAVLGAVGWTIQRRRRRSAERRHLLATAVEEARGRFAHVMLEAEELDAEPGRLLQEGAMSIGEELDRLERTPAQNPRDEKLTLARIEQLKNELAALNSQVLGQRQRGKKT
jgi:hypothetical protein